MISQQGRVVAIEDGEAVVRVGGTSGCAVCDAGRGCGAGIFGRMLRKRPVEVRVINRIGANEGQAVQLGISERKYLELVFCLYAWPVIAGLLGAAIGFALASRLGLAGGLADLWALVPAVLCGGLALVRGRRKLGEFPLGDAVHLMSVAASDQASKCAAATPDRQRQTVSTAKKLKPSKR